MSQKVIYWAKEHIDHNDYLLAATHLGLCYVSCEEDLILTFKKWAKKNLPTFTRVEDSTKLKRYKIELKKYFSGEKRTFNLPLDLYGTEFQLKVWDTLLSIPYGDTLSYSDIAEKIEKPSAVRAVANAIGANPILVFVPCHRIIGKDGSLTGFRAGLDVKKRLLTLEDVEICRNTPDE